MMNVSRTFAQIIAVYIIVCAISANAAQQWTSWRGPNYDGSSDVTGLPEKWSETDGIRWKTALPGNGASTPVIMGERIFLTSVQGEGEDPDAKLLAMCIDRSSGRILWKKVMGKGEKYMRNNMASPSAAVDEKNVYFLFGNCVLTCMDHNGTQKWQRDLEKDYGENKIKFGYSASPLLYNGRLYVVVMRIDWKNTHARANGTMANNHYLLAVDPETGKTLWKHARPVSANDESQDAYTSPILYDNQILLLGGDCVTSHDPDTGREIWRWSAYNEKDSDRHRIITSPVAGDGKVFIGGPRHTFVYALRADEKGKIADGDILWKYTGGTDSTTPLYYEGVLYAIDGDRKKLMALDPNSGRELWQTKLPSKKVYRASPVGADGKVYCLGGDGKVSVFQAGRELKELAVMEMGGDLNRSTIAVSDGCLFIRTTEAIYCVGE